MFRSDELADLTDADVRLVSNMGIRVVCDLRRASRREANPDRLPTEDTPVTLNLDIAAAAMGGRESFSFEWNDNEAEQQFAERYAVRVRTVIRNPLTISSRSSSRRPPAPPHVRQRGCSASRSSPRDTRTRR